MKSFDLFTSHFPHHVHIKVRFFKLGQGFGITNNYHFKFLVYQIGFWSFRLHSFVAGEFKDEPHWYSDYLTNWNDTIVLLYFVLSSICVLAHCYTGKWDEKYLDEPAPWYYYFVQLLHEIAAIQSTMVTFLYWAFINDPARRSAPGNVHGHAMVNIINNDCNLNIFIMIIK